MHAEFFHILCLHHKLNFSKYQESLLYNENFVVLQKNSPAYARLSLLDFVDSYFIRSFASETISWR